LAVLGFSLFENFLRCPEPLFSEAFVELDSDYLHIGLRGGDGGLQSTITWSDDQSESRQIQAASYKELFVSGMCPLPVGEVVQFSISLPGVDTSVSGTAQLAWIREKKQGSFRPVGFCLAIQKFAGDGETIWTSFLNEALLGQCVADIMRSDLHEVSGEVTLLDAIEGMNDGGIGCVLVTEKDKKLVGVFTERDVLRLVESVNFATSRISEYMTKNPVVLKPSQSLDEAMALMASVPFRHFPVVEDEKLVGVISSRDLTQHMLNFVELRCARITREFEVAKGLIVHDLRSPLGSIKSMLQLLETGDPSDRADFFDSGFLSAIDLRITSMLGIIDQLLEISALTASHTSLHKTKVNITDLVVQTVASFKAMAAVKKIKIKMKLVDPVDKAYVDGRKIEQVVQNLVSNALKFSEQEKTIAIYLGQEEDQFKIQVEDEGPGIREAEIPNLFKEFARTSNRPTAGESSTGLGLAIVNRIVEAHQGTIDLITNEGKGSTFVVKIPMGNVNE
jgi:signal transduction histidine kinase